MSIFNGDRKDGELLRDLDGMHFIMPLIYPNRCDNEAHISERIDLTAIIEYIKRSEDDSNRKYSVFDIIVTAILKTVMLRPKMNRFIVNGNTYQRNTISASFVVKKDFRDDGAEGLVFIKATEDSTLSEIHDMIAEQASSFRRGHTGTTADSMEFFNRMPRFLGKTLVGFIRFLDRHGWVPKSYIAEDPYYSSIVLSNLGSIRLKSGYHHLTNWGTNSLFLAIGEKKRRPFFDRQGRMTLKDSIDIGFTIDERLADGYYYSKSIRLFKKLLDNPALLEQPLSQEI